MIESLFEGTYLELRESKKTLENFSIWRLQNKMTLFILIGILFLSTLFSLASIMFPTMSTAPSLLFIIMAPTLACFGIATCHASNLESEKAKRDYERLVQKALEAETSQLTLDRFFSLSTDLMAVAGNDGYLKKVSRSLVKTLGYSEEILLTTPFAEFIHPDDVEMTKRAIEALNMGARQIGFENRYRAHDGTYRTLSWSAAADLELGVRFASARDVTHEKK